MDPNLILNPYYYFAHIVWGSHIQRLYYRWAGVSTSPGKVKAGIWMGFLRSFFAGAPEAGLVPSLTCVPGVHCYLLF